VNRLICAACGAAYALEAPRWKCDCGGLLDVQFNAEIHPDALGCRKPTMWRYREALPVGGDEHIVSLDEGFTPLLETQVAGRSIWLKQEQLFPTGSYKDRGAALLISKAKESGISRVVEDSSGNAGCAVAAYAARAGMACDIYVPAAASPEKLAQIRMYGAVLHKIPGTRENTARAAMQAAETCFYASHVWNPFFFQGTKTFAYEVWEQLGFNAPDALLMPVGNGTLVLGAHIGFQDLLRQGHISRLPRIVAVQSENCAPIYRMWRDNLAGIPPVKPGSTVAEGIAIAEPARAKQIVDAIRNSNGEVRTVTDNETRAACLDMSRQGLYIEPTSATAIAAFNRDPVAKEETVVVPLTGHGLKSTEKFLEWLGA